MVKRRATQPQPSHKEPERPQRPQNPAGQDPRAPEDARGGGRERGREREKKERERERKRERRERERERKPGIEWALMIPYRWAGSRLLASYRTQILLVWQVFVDGLAVGIAFGNDEFSLGVALKLCWLGFWHSTAPCWNVYDRRY